MFVARYSKYFTSKFQILQITLGSNHLNGIWTHLRTLNLNVLNLFAWLNAILMLVKLPNHEGRRTWNLHRTWLPRYLKLCSCRSEHCSSMCWIAMIPCAWRQGSLGHRGIGCWVMESEEWKGMEKSMIFFWGSGMLSRLWGTWIMTNHPCSISSHQEIINEVNLRLTLILVIPKTPKTDLSNMCKQGVY